MSATRSIARLEADLAALRAAAERAGTSLACLFSTSDEFEAAVVQVRREQGAYQPPAAAAMGARDDRRAGARFPGDLTDAFA